MNQIKRWSDGKLIHRGEETIRKLAEINKANLSGADLSRADLSRADLSGADLSGANLSRANLSRADLSGADFSGADLSRANLSGADLSRADLSRANIEFALFPSIRLLSSISLVDLPDNLQNELMHRDAYAHPYPEKFDIWAHGGECPYQNEERFWKFEAKRSCWSPGLPQMADRDLIISIVKSQGWTIKEVK